MWVFNPFTVNLDWAGSGGGGSSTFDALTDTPASKAGKAGYAVVVNVATNALEYVTSVQAFDGGSFADTYTDTVDFD